MKKIIIILGVIIGLLVGVGFFLPQDFSIERSISIKSEKEKVYALIGDLTKWDIWTPWKEQDPTIKTTFGESTSGVGASQSWVGKESGDGRLTFTKADPEKGIEYDLYFNQDQYKNIAGMRFDESSEEKTQKLTWYMKGKIGSPVIGGYIVLFMKPSLEKIFDKGLKKIKDNIEKN